MSPAGVILVVDDEQSIRHLVSVALSCEGYQVVVADNGAAALEEIARIDPDLVLLDMRMPVMDGREFLRVYRSRPGKHAPVILLTAADDAEGGGGEIDADAYLVKPFELDEMLDLVRQYMERRESGP